MASTTDDPFSFTLVPGPPHTYYGPTETLPERTDADTHIELMVEYTAEGTPILDGFFCLGPQSKQFWRETIIFDGTYTLHLGRPLPRPADNGTSPLSPLLGLIWNHPLASKE